MRSSLNSPLFQPELVLMVPEAAAVLATLPANDAGQRTQIVHCSRPGAGSWIELRQQSWGGAALGWFTQNSLRLDHRQVAQLRAAIPTLGAGESRSADGNSADLDHPVTIPFPG